MRSTDKMLNMTEGSPVRLLILFSIPMMIGNLFQQLYNLADSIIVGQMIGSHALAAIGATNSACFFFFAICNGIGSGGGVITAQCFGEGDTSQVKSCIANVGYIMTALPLVVGAAAFIFAHPLLVLLQTPADIFDSALSYFRIMCVGLLFVSIYNYVSSMLRALGDSRSPLYFLIFSCLLNIFLDILFVKYLDMGVDGAGIATVISQLVSGALCLVYAIRKNQFFQLRRNDFSYNGEIVVRSMRIGIPLSFQFSMIAISCMAMQCVVNAFGAVAIAAFTATSRIEQLVHLPYQTLSASLSTYTAQNYGAKKMHRLSKGYKSANSIMLGFTLFIFLVMQIFGRPISAMFVNDSDVIEMGVKALKITSLFYIFLGMIYLVRGILNGVGDAFFSLLNGFVEVIGRFTVPFFLTAIPAINVWGLWWASGIVWFFSGLTAWMRYRVCKKKLKF